VSSPCCTCCSPAATTPTASRRSRTRRSVSSGCSSSSCQVSPRSPRCWPCFSSSTPGATPAATATAACSPPTKQERSRWDHAAIAEGLEVLARTREDGPYGLQARIAACHAAATPADATDWPAITKWYDGLARIQPSPVIELNRAVAHGYAHGSAAGLALLAEARAGGALNDYPLAIAAEADLTARDRAVVLFRQAAAVAHFEPESRALLDPPQRTLRIDGNRRPSLAQSDARGRAVTPARRPGRGCPQGVIASQCLDP
jgi:hypothetical protein